VLAAVEEAGRLLVPAGTPEPAQLGLDEDLRALALIDLGIAEGWSFHFQAAERHLEQAITVARQNERPYLEFSGLAYAAYFIPPGSFGLAAERGRQAVELADRHGWSEEPVAVLAYVGRSSPMVWQGRLDEAEPWLDRAERVLRAPYPMIGELLHYFRGMLELARALRAGATRVRSSRAHGRAACHIQPAHDADPGVQAANPGPAGRLRARGTGPR
jgi:LuxR family maltose regulon positive regulatory protein